MADEQVMSCNIATNIGGAGIVISPPSGPQIELSHPLGATYSSFNAELEAAIVAFGNLQVQRASSILWATDSRSVLEALDGNISKASDRVQQLWRQIARLVNIGISVTALWVPLHCGLSENEKADFLANKTIKMAFEQRSKSHIRYEEVKALTRQRQSTRLLCIEDVDPGKQKDYRARRVEVVLNQLRAGYSPLVRTFRTADAYDPTCMACPMGTPETVDHLLRRCIGRASARRKHFRVQSRLDIEDLCTKYPQQVLGFLLDVGLLEDSGR